MARHQVLAVAFGIAILCVSAVPAIVTWRATKNLLLWRSLPEFAWVVVFAWLMLVLGITLCAHFVLRALWPK